MQSRIKRMLAGVLVLCCLICWSPMVLAADEDKSDTPTEDLVAKNAELEETIKTLQTQIAELEKKIAALEQENEELKAELEGPGTDIIGTEYTSQPVVKLVQEELNKNGYNCGAPDGVAGAQTVESLKAYQKDHKINVNGVITDELLEAMGIADKIDEAAKLEASKAEYSSDYTYDQLARNPDSYVGDKVKFSGKVLQADTSGSSGFVRLAANGDYNTVLFITYDSDLLSYRLLEDDYITVYGTAKSTYSYETVLGATVTIPWIVADIIELQ